MNPLLSLLLLVLLLIYAASARKMWLFHHVAYGPKGRWANLNPDTSALLFTWAPLFNSIACLVEWGDDGSEVVQPKLGKDYSNHFNISKPTPPSHPFDEWWKHE